MARKLTAAICLFTLEFTGTSAQTVLTDTLSEVTVTETRHSHTLKSTAPMHVIDRHDMLTLGIADMADALHHLPGITLRDYGGAGGMKTVSVRGFGTKHTGVSYDGVMLSECQSGETDLSRYALDNVAHLTLTIGDNDDIFIPARNVTTPAVIAINTWQMAHDKRQMMTVQVKAGSFGYVSPYLRYDRRLSQNAEMSAIGEFVYAENDYPYTIKNGIETINDRRQNSRMNQGHAEVNFKYEKRRKEFWGKVYYYDNDRQLPGQVFYYSNTSRETLRDRNLFGQFAYQMPWNERLSMKWLGKFNWTASLYDDGMVANWSQDGDYYQREAYTSLCLLYAPHDHWAFDYSADYAFNNLNSSLPTDTRPYRNTVLQSATAKYHTGRLTVMGRLLYSLYLNGARDGEASNDMRRLSPSISLSYALTSCLRLRASYKDIFRAPTFNENYFFHYGNKDLKPEDTQQVNVGVTYAAKAMQHAQRHTELTATADLYYNKVKEMIQGVPYNMFVWTCINIGKVEVLGLDATLKGVHHIGGHTLTASANYSLQQARNRTNEESPYYNNQIAYTPLHSGAASLSWENPWVNLTVSGHRIGERWASNENLDGTRINSYGELNVTAWRQFQVRNTNIELRFDVKNLTDKQYEIVRSYPMPGRSWQMTIRMKM
ncbi:MAG: TonB-dependent receptor [Prevotella sp.]|nr:TonB-dependent receptor [Prevotella sp.]